MTAFRLELRRNRSVALWLGVMLAVYGVLMGLIYPIMLQNDDLMREYIETYDHWTAFAMLALVGGKMLWEGVCGGKDDPGCEPKDPIRGGQLLLLAVATSIDALAVGLSFAVLGQGIALPALVIGVVCFALTALGVKIGCLARRVSVLSRYAELLGGLVLIGIGLKILAEHQALPF